MGGAIGIIIFSEVEVDLSSSIISGNNQPYFVLNVDSIIHQCRPRSESEINHSNIIAGLLDLTYVMRILPAKLCICLPSLVELDRTQWLRIRLKKMQDLKQI